MNDRWTAAGNEDGEVTVDVNKNEEHEGDIADHSPTNREKSVHELQFVFSQSMPYKQQNGAS